MSSARAKKQKAPLDMSKHFTVPDLVKYVLPAIGMMLCTSMYAIVDALFVSNCAGTTAFAALNLVQPLLMILATVGFMLGAGGSAIVAKTRGEGDDERANGIFSMLVYVCLIIGVIFVIVGQIVLEPVMALMGAEGEMMEQCCIYGRVLLSFVPAFIMQYAFGAFFNTAGKPILGFVFSVLAGISNIVLDAILIPGMGLGLLGAAVGSGISMVVSGLIPIIYFARKNTSCLSLGKPLMDMRALGRAAVNGSSEMVANIALSLVSMVYNYQLMIFFGENGVAAYGVIMYVAMIFSGMFSGYSLGSSPLMSYQYGAQNKREMHSLFKNDLKIIVVLGVLMCAIAEIAAPYLSWLFVGYDPELLELTTYAFRVYAIAFLLMGVNIFGSAFFTSLNNGLVSALISFIRAFICEIGCVLLLPMLFGADAIWASIIVAEFASLILTVAFMLKLGNSYGYLHAPKDEQTQEPASQE